MKTESKGEPKVSLADERERDTGLVDTTFPSLDKDKSVNNWKVSCNQDYTFTSHKVKNKSPVSCCPIVTN